MRYFKWKTHLVVGLALVWAVPGARGNNLAISNVTLGTPSNGAVEVAFDLSWDNSWRASWIEDGGAINVESWDAAWLFIKFRASGGFWHHGSLASTAHSPDCGDDTTTLDLAANADNTKVGALLYRSAESSGTLSCTDVRLKWQYDASGLAGTNEVDVSVHGIEMVYIPEGPFKVGSGGTERGHFYEYPDTDMPYTVTGEEAITVAANAGDLYYTGDGDFSGPIPAAFPKGYAAFYCMKYEITQGQYADYLNMLETAHAWARFANTGGSGYSITLAEGVYTAAAPDRACNYLNSGDDIFTYLDWAGLRPMTELEFEKVCRGPIDPYPNEFVWGNNAYVQHTGHEGDIGSGTETATPATANVNYDIGGAYHTSPVRVGIYATATSTRAESGAGYYGVMNLGGNVFEYAVTVGNSAGRGFLGEHGDGNELARPASWGGAGRRGGDFYYGYNYAPHGGSPFAPHTSYRYYVSNGWGRELSSGGRGVRTAPEQ